MEKKMAAIDIPVVTCRRCRVLKIFSQLRKPKKDGKLHKICKSCSMQEAMAWGKLNPERKSLADKRFNEKHREKILQKRKKYYWDNRQGILRKTAERRAKYPWIYAGASHKRNRSKSKFYQRMIRKQNGVCGICQERPSGIALHVDHDHNTGERRGLLCDQCNTALGQFLDDTSLLQRAINYLDNPPSRSA
jgi:hypothetical protein